MRPRTRISLLLVGPVVLALSVAALRPVWSGEPDGPSGLSGALNGTRDPSEEPRRPQPAEEPAGGKKEESPKPRTSPAALPLPDTKTLDERIKELNSIGYDDVKPVSSLEEAKQRINALRAQARQLQLRADDSTARTVNSMAEHSECLRKKWQTLIAAMNDGKKRDATAWTEIARDIRANMPEVEAPADRRTPEEAVDGFFDQPTEEELASGSEGEEPSEAGVDPLDPAGEPKPETEVKAPDLADLAKAIKEHGKPDGMHPLTWAILDDEFQGDMAELEMAVAKARSKLKEEREAAYAPVANALRQAQQTYSDLKKLGGDAAEPFRRHLAWRMKQAELAQLRLMRSDIEALKKEREGKESGRQPMIEIRPDAPEKTLQDIARLMHVDGRAGAPSPDAFDNLDADGLPPLYPGGLPKGEDKTLHYGELVKANIDRYQRLLRDIRRKQVDVVNMVDEEDRQARREEWASLVCEDAWAHRLDNPVNKAKRRVALQDMYREQRATRAERVTKRTQELEKEAERTVERLKVEYERRDEILKAEEAIKPKPPDNGADD